MNEQLKPCPHCGGKMEVIDIMFSVDGEWGFRCVDCGSDTGYCKSYEDAVKLANSRPVETAQYEKITELENNLNQVKEWNEKLRLTNSQYKEALEQINSLFDIWVEAQEVGNDYLIYKMDIIAKKALKGGT